MRFNVLATIPPPTKPEKCRCFLKTLPTLIDGAQVTGWENLSDEDVVKLVREVWFKITTIPIIDEGVNKA